eukprot:1631334-Amphidinium_carterae.1
MPMMTLRLMLPCHSLIAELASNTAHHAHPIRILSKAVTRPHNPMPQLELYTASRNLCERADLEVGGRLPYLSSCSPRPRQSRPMIQQRQSAEEVQVRVICPRISEGQCQLQSALPITAECAPCSTRAQFCN